MKWIDRAYSALDRRFGGDRLGQRPVPKVLAAIDARHPMAGVLLRSAFISLAITAVFLVMTGAQSTTDAVFVLGIGTAVLYLWIGGGVRWRRRNPR